MSEYGSPEIQRRSDGSIDIAFYTARGLDARSELAHDSARHATQMVASRVSLLAFLPARAALGRVIGKFRPLLRANPPIR